VIKLIIRAIKCQEWYDPWHLAGPGGGQEIRSRQA
jgi:hypothetical protein